MYASGMQYLSKIKYEIKYLILDTYNLDTV